MSSQDHPRLRGENEGLLRRENAHVGSPPPTRGKLVVFDLRHLHEGITPAYAGNTMVSPYDIACGQDHPRLRGETLKKIP